MQKGVEGRMKEETRKPITAKEIRKEYGNLYRKLLKRTGNNCTRRYLAKMRYMAFWLSSIPCKKSIVDNWEMPDYNTIMNLDSTKSKEGKGDD
jgi:hypothetical protein